MFGCGSIATVWSGHGQIEEQTKKRPTCALVIET
jgi:hypothetical protein